MITELKTKVPVSEIFSSIQGEGVNAGKPSIFVRFGVCNLSCGYLREGSEWEVIPGAWQCDAWYSWQNAKDYKMLEIQDISDTLMSMGLGRSIKHLIFTGGEPMLKQGVMAEIVDTLSQPSGFDFEIEVETNGTIVPNDMIARLVRWWDISPKLSNSGQPHHRRINQEAIIALREIRKAYFKFVISEPEDITEAERDFILPFKIPNNKVLLMPEGIDVPALNRRSKWLAKVCVEKGYRLSPRLQIYCFGNKRGT